MVGKSNGSRLHVEKGGGTGLANLSPKSVQLFFPFFIGQTGPPETWGSLCPDVHSERYVRPIRTGLGVCLVDIEQYFMTVT